MLHLSVLAVLVASVCCLKVELDVEWQLFKIKYKKNYKHGEETERRAIWENNVGFIHRHNLEADLGLHTYRLGQNKYADMSHLEFLGLVTGFRQLPVKTKLTSRVLNGSDVGLPDTVDWRKEGYVTPVKDQADCGACWAFSATGSLEGQHFKKTGKLISLSEQNLVDCSRNGRESHWKRVHDGPVSKRTSPNKLGNLGCEGGHMALAFDYIRMNNGIDTEGSYPYVARQEECKFRREFVGATDKGFAAVISESESALKSAVALEGPISVGMDATPLTFALYKSGVYSDRSCSSTILNHAVTAVGYGTVDGTDYWLLKNSWGTSWGDGGYVLMARNDGNMCGVATDAILPIV